LEWKKIDIEDTLILLSNFFNNIIVVRSYAYEILKSISNEELNIMLLQLVQSLRYEKVIKKKLIF
jgi:phosphatidylinositol 3-kinase